MPRKSNPDGPLTPIKDMLGSCLAGELKGGGTPLEIAGRTVDCFRLKLGTMLAYGDENLPLDPLDPPAPAAANPASTNPGAPDKK